jgi:hypothetical protein
MIRGGLAFYFVFITFCFINLYGFYSVFQFEYVKILLFLILLFIDLLIDLFLI